jgi:hypothetical protein
MAERLSPPYDDRRPTLTCDAASTVSGMWRRLAVRFALIVFGLYHVPLFLNNYPSLGGGGFRADGLARDWGGVFGQVGLWVAIGAVRGRRGPRKRCACCCATRSRSVSRAMRSQS